MSREGLVLRESGTFNMAEAGIAHPKSLISAICIACVLTLVSMSPSDAAYDDAKGFRVAADLLNQGSYLEALAAYQEIVVHSESYESRAKGLFFMGTIYSLYLDQFDEALRLYGIVIRDYSRSSYAQDALFNTGMVLYEKGAFADAYKRFKKYLEQHPAGKHRHSAEVWAESARVEMAAGKAEEPGPPRGLAVDDTTVRVLVQDKAPAVTFHAPGLITIYEPSLGRTVWEGYGPVSLTCKTSRLLFNGVDLKVSRCMITGKERILALDGKRYRGSFLVLVQNGGELQVINYVDIENYLYGVVPREMSPTWAEDALKAQAVASRTYALYVKEKSTDKAYDLVATTASQVYGGYDAETPASTKAVDATRGEVMTYNGWLTIAYFHANSGGFTESAKNVWVADLPYLRGLPDPHSDNVSNGIWEVFLSYQAVEEQLNQYGLNVGVISHIRPADASPSGRPLKVAVESSRGRIVLKSNDFRLKIGASELRSTFFRMHEGAGGVQINGKGFGHGVGMSQWGAYRMAQAGYNYRDILRYYYKGVEITRLMSSR